MTEFFVADMTCGGCSSAITRAIRSVDADSKVEIDLHKRTVRIASPKSPAQFQDSIRAAGYTPVMGAEARAQSTPSCCQS